MLLIITSTNYDKKDKNEIQISRINFEVDDNHDLTLDYITPLLTKW